MSFPSSVFVTIFTPICLIFSIVFCTISLFSLNSGIPCVSIPPASLYFSYIVTFIPFFAKKAPAVSPAGPLPIMATFLFVNFSSISLGTF